MNILIVEDDPPKLSQLEREVRNIVPSASLETATSLRDALGILQDLQFQWVLLDMALPSHSSASGAADVYSQPVGGLDVLLYLAFGDRPERVVILTQYPTVEYNQEHVPLHKLQEKLRIDDVCNVSDVVLFAEDGEWKPRLRKALETAQ